jgi:hypothetical protein
MTIVTRSWYCAGMWYEISKCILSSLRLALGPPLARRHHHIDLATTALRADQPIAPIEHGHLGTVPLSVLAGVGLDLMAARFAPHDQPHASRSGAAPRVIGGPGSDFNPRRRRPRMNRGGSECFGSGNGSRARRFALKRHGPWYSNPDPESIEILEAF